MIRMEVNDVHDFTRRALAAFDDMPIDVFGFVEAGADILRATDPYQNHTWNLRNGTQAVNVNDDVDPFHFELVMDMHYASFVNDLGFSRVDEIGERGGVIDTAIMGYLEGAMARKIAG